VCVACVLAMLGISFTGFVYTLVTGGALSWTYSLARLFLPWIGRNCLARSVFRLT